MKLCKSETFAVLNDHDRGVGYVYPYFDDYCRDQHLDLTFLEIHHDAVFFLGFHGSVDQSHPDVGISDPEFVKDLFSRPYLDGVGLLYQGSHHVGLASVLHLVSDKIIYLVP